MIRPRQLARLRERPDLVHGAATELLRYVQLVGFAVARSAVEDIELGGVLVRAGEPVVTAPAAADRDAAAFPDADDLVLDRRRAARGVPRPHRPWRLPSSVLTRCAAHCGRPWYVPLPRLPRLPRVCGGDDGTPPPRER
ncbi:cytochrome P450 [Streptomyces poonensis]|uniref:cytochrome P450 n=1 Tax=Streptomyces poonensis TaxID=68255 RepID=UPI00167B76EB